MLIREGIDYTAAFNLLFNNKGGNDFELFRTTAEAGKTAKRF